MNHSVAVLGRYLFQLAMHDQIRPGDRMLPERELAQQLAMSRESLREALSYFGAKGIVMRVHGVGNFVASDVSFLELIAPDSSRERDLFEVRLVLEPYIAGLAAKRASKLHRTRLAASMAQMSLVCRDEGAFRMADYEFHRAILEACGNPILCSLMGPQCFPVDKWRCQCGKLDVSHVLDLHKEIYNAVRYGHSQRAQELVRMLSLTRS